jgi:hypothetical protein
MQEEGNGLKRFFFPQRCKRNNPDEKVCEKTMKLEMIQRGEEGTLPKLPSTI